MENQSSLFIKWFITFAATIAAGLIAAHYGFFSLVFSTDISRISLGMTILFVLTSLLMGKLSYDLSHTRIPMKIVKKRLQIANFVADILFTLGLLGTIIGFCYMMGKTLNSGIDVTEIISQMKIGTSTTLFTTLFGIIGSLLLQLQILFVNLEVSKD